MVLDKHVTNCEQNEWRSLLQKIVIEHHIEKPALISNFSKIQKVDFADASMFTSFFSRTVC